MKLTSEQQNLVSENHNLIYWYASLAHLDLEEWYDLLAIELCHTIIKYDPSRGSIANYFKLRCDGLVYKEYKKSQSMKRNGTTTSYIENIHTITEEDWLEEIEFKEWMDIENGDILKLKSQGFTQSEIARELGVSQSYISKILKKFKKEYYNCGYKR